MNAHNKTPEQLALEEEGDSFARHQPYIKLGLAVLMKAVEDATRDVPPVGTIPTQEDQVATWNAQRAAREEARAFLTVENTSLSFWCWVAGIQMPTLLHYAKGAAGQWEQMGKLLRRQRLHYRRAS